MIPVILSGGGGTRLWPVSRPSMPKQFADLLDESLFVKTAKRLLPLGKPWVITVEGMRELTERSLKELGLPTEQVVYEPYGRNTATAVALLCARFRQLGLSEEIVGIFPADHLIDNEDRFLAAVREAESFAAQGEICTLGIKPTFPATGYGYIETSEKMSESRVGFKATRFREKPNAETAKDFIDSGKFFWNGGIFIFRVKTMLELFEKHAPETLQWVTKAVNSEVALAKAYDEIKPTSIDYAIMEKLKSHVCIPCAFGWNDLGSWDSLVEVGAASSTSKSHEVECSENFVFSKLEKTYGFVGCSDLIVVDTPEALLISKRGHTESVKQLVEKAAKS